MTTQTECIFEAKQKEIMMEETLNKPHMLVAGYRAYQYGLVVGYKVGCKGVK